MNSTSNKSNKKVGRKRGDTFIYEKLSSSMMKTWLLCKRKFHLNYVDGVEEPPNTSFSLGNAVHYALEMAYEDLKNEPRELTEDEIEFYIQYFREYMAGAITEGHFIDNPYLFTEGEQLVKTELNSINYSEKILDTEKKFDIITPEGVRIYGFMDKVVEVDEDTVKIEDYKTSRMPMSTEEAETDVQISMYELAAAILYPQYKNRKVELNYLRDQTRLQSIRTPIAQYNFRKQLVAVDKAIRKYVDEVNASNVPEGSINIFCRWCSYKTVCPTYNKQLIQLGSAYSLPTTITDKKFIEEYRKVTNSIKELEAYKDDLKLWAVQRMELEQDVPIEDGESIVSTLSTTRKNYDPEEISKYLDYEDFIKLVTINNSKMSKFLSNLRDPSIRSGIEKGMSVKFNNPQIRLKKGR